MLPKVKLAPKRRQLHLQQYSTKRVLSNPTTRPCVSTRVPWGSASFAWQAWDNVHCQGVGCTPWRPLGLRRFGVAGVVPSLFRGRRGTMCTAKGSDVRPGVPRGSASFAWQAWDNVHCQGVGCTSWRALGLRRFCVAGVAGVAVTHSLTHSLIHSHISHSHTPHSHHSLTVSLTHLCTWLIIIIIIVIIINDIINIIIMMLVLEYDNSTSESK